MPDEVAINENAALEKIEKPKAESRGGFTIVELLVTVVISAIIIPAVAVALTNLAITNKQARSAVLVNTLAQNKVETLRSNGYNSLANITTDFSDELTAKIGGPKSASYTVSTPQTGLKQIDINISYTEYNKTRELIYRTYISELGVGQ